MSRRVKSSSPAKRRLSGRSAAVAVATAAAFAGFSAVAQNLDAPPTQDDALENGRDPAPGVASPEVDQSPSLDAPSTPSPDAPPDEEAVRKQATNGLERAETGFEDDAADQTEEEALTREERLLRAFDQLASEVEEDWRAAEDEIARTWSKSGSASADLLLIRGRDAMEREAWDEAEKHFTDLVTLVPSFAEGWNMRATLYFRQERFGRSLADIGETLALEPRHFGALSGLGVIMEALDHEMRAFEAFQRALEIHPNLEGAQEAIKRLKPRAEGMAI